MPTKSQITPTRIQLRGSSRWVEIDDFESVASSPLLNPSSSHARTRIRPSARGRSRICLRPPTADSEFVEDSEEDIIPKKISRAKKRGAPQDDHSSAKDTSQDGRDDDDDEDDAEDASQDGLDNPTTSGIVHTPQDGHEDPEDTLQDGLGNPNVSSITPPIPANLVEPVLVGHETHFHVVTSGTEVGIFTNRGLADARLQCEFPSCVTFSMWALAMAHYVECFVDGSVTIQCALEPQTPISSPAQKKRRSAFESPYSPLLFPASPPIPEHTVKKQKHPLSLCETLAPKRPVEKRFVTHQKPRFTRAEARIRKASIPSPSGNIPLLSPFSSRAQPARPVYVEDKSTDSDEEGTFAALVRLAAAMPIARRSSPITVHNSDSEYLVSDVELTDDVLKLLDAPVHPTTAALSAGVVPSTSSPIIIYASDLEYDHSDIELDDNTIRLLDQTN